MKTQLLLSVLTCLASSPASAYTVPKPGGSNVVSNRRAFLSKVATTAAAATVASSNVAPSSAVDDNLQNVYFGAGCYWHVQHEFVLAERSILGRKDSELTSLTGYAGGFKTDSEGRVCYHNFQSIADYGKLGHGEVVGMTIPESKIEDFAVEYFKLFNDKGERADPMDKGGEYRSLLGLPGGSKHPSYPQVEAAGKAKGMTLVDGKGNDPDTLGKRLVYVYDSDKFPFYQAEFYHQYHNDFLSPAYGKEYNNLAQTALDDGRIKITGCPDRV
jgi:peptide methionine sulfoxide reductase MsrA